MPSLFSSFATELTGAPSRIKTRRSTVSKNFAILLLCLSALSVFAFADEWTKTYQVGSNPSLRVDTNDASIEVTQGVSKTISARVISEGYNIGSTGVRVTERQDADKVDLQVHIPNDWGLHISMHRGVRVEIQVPPQTALDLHSGDGHISLNGTSG